jgi:preprotein translocase subunit SecE
MTKMDKVRELTAKVPQFASDVEVEMKRISWPLIKETVRSTGAVIFISLILASFLGLVDFLFSLIVRSILS